MSRSYLEALFWQQLEALDLPMPAKEYRFDPIRRWRLDFAWPDLKLAVEIEGGVWSGGRHVRGAGFLGDIEKHNALAMGGWCLLRFDGGAVRSGSACEQVRKALLVFYS